jgi:hypothetical protein
LRERVFRDREYYWWDDFEEDEPRPATIEGIWESERMKESGTHSILDVNRVLATTDAPDWDNWQVDLGTVRPLAAGRVMRHFGTGRPSRAQFEELAGGPEGPGPGPAPMAFADEVKMRGTGLYVLLYDNDQPAEVGIWGASGD